MAKGTASRVNIEFSTAYIESVFATWQMHDKPTIGALIDLIEPDEQGRKPVPITIANWKEKYAWESRDLQIQVQVQENTDRELVKVRMDMMKRHAERAKDIGEMAFKYLRDTGFDSSASAVAAAFKAFAEEKQSTGMGIALAQVFSMSDADLQKKLNSLLSRVTDIENDENTVTGETEELDAPSQQETTDE